MIRWAGACLALLGTVAHAQSDQGLYLYEIEVVGGEGVDFSGDSLVVDLVAEDVKRLAQALSDTTVEVQSADSRGLRVTLSGDDHFTRQPDANLVASSWVVDFDEPSVQSLLRSLRETPANDKCL